MKKKFKEIIQEICNEENIKYTFLSKDWVIMLEKDGKTRFISGYKFDLNSQAIGLIADDKYALYDVLKSKGIPVIEHKIVYKKTNKLDYAVGCNSYEYVKDYFLKNNNHIVIKPNEGSCGHNVFNVTEVNEIDIILDKLFTNNYSISICPFYNIKHEYRAIMLDGEKKLIYTKYLPIVTGDGCKTIRQLLLDFNHDYFIDKLEDSRYDKVLAKNEEFKYNWKFNLSQGSIAKRLNDELLENKLIQIAKQVCNEINLKFGCIDIIQTDNNDLYVLEVNSGVMIENYIRLNPDEYVTAKNIYKGAIERLFNS